MVDDRECQPYAVGASFLSTPNADVSLGAGLMVTDPVYPLGNETDSITVSSSLAQSIRMAIDRLLVCGARRISEAYRANQN